MTSEFHERVEPWCFPLGDTTAKLLLSVAEAVSAPGYQSIEMHGMLDGPHCSATRTLAARFAVRSGVDMQGHAFAMADVTDPCYWTPTLPFLYRLSLDVTTSEASTTIEQMIGLRRWECDGASFRLERKRVVLRGAADPVAVEATLDDARNSEAALIVGNPSDQICREASRRGVVLVADLRGHGKATSARLRHLAWHSAVLAALVDDRSWAPGDLLPIVRLGCVVSGEGACIERPWADFLAVELHQQQRPSAWLASCNKLVIAIRRGVAYADLHEARAACDRLQADLAPEFNLAGYFVASE